MRSLTGGRLYKIAHRASRRNSSGRMRVWAMGPTHHSHRDASGSPQRLAPRPLADKEVIDLLRHRSGAAPILSNHACPRAIGYRHSARLRATCGLWRQSGAEKIHVSYPHDRRRLGCGPASSVPALAQQDQFGTATEAKGHGRKGGLGG
jgi:hypothetical protein